nr:MAG TPA: hypothetical protein [Caudoviricetes sp.]
MSCQTALSLQQVFFLAEDQQKTTQRHSLPKVKFKVLKS